jgi:hypothetical protein
MKGDDMSNFSELSHERIYQLWFPSFVQPCTVWRVVFFNYLVISSSSEEYEPWVLFPLDDGWYAIVAEKDGKAMSISENKNGAVVGVTDWSNDKKQHWVILEEGSSQDGVVCSLEDRFSGKRLGSKNVAETPQYVRIADKGLSGYFQQWVAKVVASLKLPSFPKTQETPKAPEFSSYGQTLPDNTDPVVTAYTLIPCIMVQDNWDAKQKIKETPYYLLVKKEYWRKEFQFDVSKGGEKQGTERWGMRETERDEMEWKVGIEVKADAGFNVKGFSASRAIAITGELRVNRSTEREKITEKSETNVYKAIDTNTSFAKYSRVCRFCLQRTNGTQIGESWEVVKHKDTRLSTWPKNVSVEVVPLMAHTTR